MEHLTGYNRPKLIRDHLWEHKCSNTKYVLYNKISEQKSPSEPVSVWVVAPNTCTFSGI